MAGRAYRFYQQCAGIAYGRGSCIAYQSDRLALRQQGDDLFCRAAFIVLMQRHKTLCGDSIMRQQVCGVARILGGNGIRRDQNIQRTQTDVTQIPNRGGNYI